MIRTVIMDDEPRNVKLVAKLVADYCPDLEVVGMTDDLSEGLPLIESLKPSLLLLDIEFPHGTVFHMLDKLSFRDFQVIFITAYNSYASEAFQHHAVDYLLKPVTSDALVHAVKKVEERMERHVLQDLSKLIEFMKSQYDSSGKIPLSTAEGILFVHESEIIHCEASGRYSIIHLDAKKKLTITKTLKEIEALLNTVNFFRKHHSHIINLKKIARVP